MKDDINTAIQHLTVAQGITVLRAAMEIDADEGRSELPTVKELLWNASDHIQEAIDILEDLEI